MPNIYDLGMDTRGVITYGGEASSGFGMVVAEAPTFERPARKQTAYTVPGRNGSVIFQQDAFEDVVRSYKVWIAEEITEDSGGNISGTLAERVDAFEAMLNSKKGYTRLEDTFEPDVFRLAYYSGGNDFTNEMTQYGEATLTFTCRPERFYKSGETEISVSNGDTIVNGTRFASKPLIHIEGTGAVSVSIGGVTINATLGAPSDYVNIDCETMNAYRLPTENKNNIISGTFPTIKAGSNGIAITGSVTLCKITPRFYTI